MTVHIRLYTDDNVEGVCCKKTCDVGIYLSLSDDRLVHITALKSVDEMSLLRKSIAIAMFQCTELYYMQIVLTSAKDKITHPSVWYASVVCFDSVEHKYSGLCLSGHPADPL
jgi:hypothetical protein